MTDQSATCHLSIDYSERVNFAFQQNFIPVIRRIEKAVAKCLPQDFAKTTQICDAAVQHLIAEQTIFLEDDYYKISK